VEKNERVNAIRKGDDDGDMLSVVISKLCDNGYEIQEMK
jgi:hypothetical protein